MHPLGCGDQRLGEAVGQLPNDTVQVVAAVDLIGHAGLDKSLYMR